jgi:hypothetical protein
MYRKILIFAGLFTVGWLGYFTLINVNQKDVTLLQQLDRPVGTQLFRAGDLVEVSADGTRLSFLCAMDVAEGDLREAPHAKRYVNGLAQSLGGFARVVNWVKSSVTGTDSAALEADDALAVEFRGKVTSIPSGTLPVPSQPCTCAIAEAMLRRSKVCMVSRSMNETRLVRQNPLDPKSMLTLRESAIGVSFRESARSGTSVN